MIQSSILKKLMTYNNNNFLISVSVGQGISGCGLSGRTSPVIAEGGTEWDWDQWVMVGISLQVSGFLSASWFELPQNMAALDSPIIYSVAQSSSANFPVKKGKSCVASEVIQDGFMHYYVGCLWITGPPRFKGKGIWFYLLMGQGRNYFVEHVGGGLFLWQYLENILCYSDLKESKYSFFSERERNTMKEKLAWFVRLKTN